MIHTFKACGIQAAIDSRDGSVRLLDPLMFSMIPSLPSPDEMTKELPTSIRYAFAKYDSQDLGRAYGELYALYTEEKPDDRPAVTGSYLLPPGFSEDMPAKIPAGSIVTAAADSAETAERLTRDYPALNFRFASSDLSVCETFGAVYVFTFTDAADLCGKVGALFAEGQKRIAGYPAEGISEADALDAYEKLCRDLVRMRKKGEAGFFVPFVLEPSDGLLVSAAGEPFVPVKGGTFSSVYTETGRMPLNTLYLSSDALLDRCAECAVVLTAKE